MRSGSPFMEPASWPPSPPSFLSRSTTSETPVISELSELVAVLSVDVSGDVSGAATSYGHGIPAIAHQRLTPVSQPAYSSPAMPYLLMDEDDVVVLPRRRRYARLHEELDDDPVLQWYEDRIHHAQADAIFNANKRIADLCTPRARHVSTAPPYVQGKYKEPLPAEFYKYRTPTTEYLKPIHANIELKSRLARGPGPAEYRYRRYDDAGRRSSAEQSRDL